MAEHALEGELKSEQEDGRMCGEKRSVVMRWGRWRSRGPRQQSKDLLSNIETSSSTKGKTHAATGGLGEKEFFFFFFLYLWQENHNMRGKIRRGKVALERLCAQLHLRPAAVV